MSGSDPAFSLQAVHRADSVLVRVVGELDVAAEPRFSSEARELVGGQTRCVAVDLSGLTFVDVSGLRALANFGRAAVDAGAEYRLVGVSDFVLWIIGAVGFPVLQRACASTERPALQNRPAAQSRPGPEISLSR